MAREETWAGNYGSGAINGVCHSHLLWMVTHSSQDFNLSNVWQVLRATCACLLSYNITSQINSNSGIKWKGMQPGTPLQWGCLSKGLSILYFFPGPYCSLWNASSYVCHIYKEKNSGKWVILGVNFAQEKGCHISLLISETAFMLSHYSVSAACGTT